MSVPGPDEMDRAMSYAANEKIRQDIVEQNWYRVYLWTAGGLMAGPGALAGLLFFLESRFPGPVRAWSGDQIAGLMAILAVIGFGSFVIIVMQVLSKRSAGD